MAARLRISLTCGILLAAAVPSTTATAEGPCDVVPDGYTLVEGTEGPDELNAPALTSSDGPFVIRGYGGDDTMRGGPLDDIICAGDGFDLIQGAGGNDMEYGEAQNDVHQTSPPTTYFQDLKDPETGEGLLLPESLNGNAQLRVTMEVPDLPSGNTMGDINVRVWISSDPGGVADIAVYTYSPFAVLNKMVEQDADRATNPTQLQGTTFDSEAVFPIKRADADRDLGGRFHPEWSLDSFYRYKQANGMWELRVIDRQKNGLRSRLEAWSLEIAYMTDDHDGADVYECGTGTEDLVDYTSRKQDLNVSLNAKPGDGQAGENDTAFKTCEWTYTGFGRDVLIGNAKFNDIRAGANNDKIIGKKGDDRFRGGEGDDYLDGGAGVDKLDGNNGTDTCVNGETYISCEIGP